MTDRLFHLLSRHQKLDEALRAEQAQRWPNLARVTNLKKLKLAVKDRLHRASLRQARTPA